MSKFECRECRGEGQVECDCCGSELDCEPCKGSGLDPDYVDIAAWTKAASEFTRKHGCSWDWNDDDRWMGRASYNGATLAIADFLCRVAGIEEPT